MHKLSDSLTEDVEKTLTSKEKTILESYSKFLGMTAGEQKIAQNRAFLLQLRDSFKKPLAEINSDDLTEFWAMLKASKYSWNSQCMKRKSVKRFVKWAFKEKSFKMLDGLKAGEFKVNRKKINKQTLIQAEELEKMLRTALSLRDKAIISLLYESAARPEELLKLKWKDVNFLSEEVHLDSNKTERARDIPIKQSTVHLKRWKQEWQFPDIKENDYVFPSRWREEKLTGTALNSIISKTSVRAGLTRNMTAYLFRHSRLTELYQKGVVGIYHNKFAGHKDGSKQQSTYSHIDNADMKEELLKKVYNIKEITPEKRAEFEKKLQEQERQMSDLLKRVKLIELNKKRK